MALAGAFWQPRDLKKFRVSHSDPAKNPAG